MSPELFSAASVQSRVGPADDRKLVEALKRGDPAAFERLVLTYQHRIFSIARRMLGNPSDAEEVAQEVFLRVHRSVQDFRGEAKLSTWLYAIASRLCLNRLRSGGRRYKREGDRGLERVVDPNPGPGEVLEESERGAALERAIAELDAERRVVVVLRDLHGLSYEEIAEALSLELGTVRSRLHRARMELKGRLARFLG